MKGHQKKKGPKSCVTNLCFFTWFQKTTWVGQDSIFFPRVNGVFQQQIAYATESGKTHDKVKGQLCFSIRWMKGKLFFMEASLGNWSSYAYVFESFTSFLAIKSVK